jgi:hypothetical protein
MARFKLMGRVIVGQEENERALTREEQNALPTELVYETDDLSEASEIQRAGGFFRDRDTFVSVTSVEDTQGSSTSFGNVGSADPQPMPQKGDN